VLSKRLPELAQIIVLYTAALLIFMAAIAVYSRALSDQDFLRQMRMAFKGYWIGAFVLGLMLFAPYYSVLAPMYSESLKHAFEKYKWHQDYEVQQSKTDGEREWAECARAVIGNSSEKILYLSWGLASYWLGNPTALRYYYPIPLVRAPNYCYG
jgi:hypothetical protein